MHILTPIGNGLLLEKDSLDVSRRMGNLHFLCNFDLIEIGTIIVMSKELVDFTRNEITIENFELLLASFWRL